MVSVGINSYYQEQSTCPDKFGCPPDICPNIVLKRHDTKPPFKVLIETCDGPMDLTDELLIVEVNMWANARLKKTISDEDTYFQVADNIGFNQIMVGDIIVMDQIRRPEHMLVIAFDEQNCLVQVQRAYNATVASIWKKGTNLRIFRIMDGTASIETVLGDVVNEDGTTSTDQILETYLVYEWQAKDTCTPGCYWLEFKLLKMAEEDDDVSMMSFDDISNISFTPSTLTASDFGCKLGEGVEWVRRFPENMEAFLIKIVNSPTMEL